MWITPPETSKADEQDVNIRETESTPQLVDVNNFNNSTNEVNSDTTKDRLDASKNDDFPTIIVNSEIKKAIIAAGPKQPEGLFPKDPLQSGRLFSTNYYHYVTQSGLKLQIYWLCYSSSMDRVYCQLCWLFSHENVSPGTFYALQNPWITAGLSDWRHLSQQIRSHESSTHHAEACVIYEQWRNRGTIEEALHKSLLEKINFWQNVLESLVNVTLMLAKCNLPFRGSMKNFRRANFSLSYSFLLNTTLF